MPHTSPSSLPAYDYLVELLSQTDDSDFIREILAALLTEKEQKEIA
ncbi:MAG: transcriptional regulator, partial [Moraxella osloensis]|nr:transcriptional regulator [Moraxella osloensis]